MFPSCKKMWKANIYGKLSICRSENKYRDCYLSTGITKAAQLAALFH